MIHHDFKVFSEVSRACQSHLLCSQATSTFRKFQTHIEAIAIAQPYVPSSQQTNSVEYNTGIDGWVTLCETKTSHFPIDAITLVAKRHHLSS